MMEKIYLLLIGAAVSLAACNGGGGGSSSSGNPPQLLGCAVNIDNKGTMSSYINSLNQELAVNPDIAAEYLKKKFPGAALYNGLIFVNGATPGAQTSIDRGIAYFVSNSPSIITDPTDRDKISHNAAGFEFTSESVTASSCYTGSFFQSGGSGKLESSPATLTNCQTTTPQAGQKYTFSATYHIGGNEPSTGKLEFSCIPEQIKSNN